MNAPTKLPVFIDCCAWDYLFGHAINLAEVFPPDDYALFVTREVEIEILAIPNLGKDGTDNRKLKDYIAKNIATLGVKTFMVFGFATLDPDGSPSKIQVYGGFDQGTWQSDEDRQWYDSAEVKSLIHNKGPRPSGLSKNQADASVAVRSFDAIVLTDERKRRNSPLRLAASQGGRVVRLQHVEQSGLSLKDYIAQLA